MNQSRIICYGTLLILTLLTGWTTHARWMNAKEADSSVLSRRIRIRVDKEAHFHMDTELKVKILNETGRIRWGTWRLNYSPKNERLKIRGAQTENPNGTFKVDERDIIDTQIFATENGFDESRQTVVSFPQVQVGSILSFEIKEEIFRPYIDGQYSNRFYFGYYDSEESANIDITSRVPLFFELNDPSGKLAFTKSEKSGDYQYNLRLKSALIHRVVDEVHSVMDEKSYTWATVSTAQNYSAMYGDLAARYERILASPLPEKLRPIVEKARREKGELRQVAVVLAELSENIRYMGDWRAVDGAYIPRSMELVASTRYGDCKDMSLVTTKILRELGLKSAVALTIRSIPPRSISSLPFLTFNHAIVSVELKDRQLWVDPTDMQSFPEGVFEDIAGREALVLDPAALKLKKIEFTAAPENLETVSSTMRLESDKIRKDHLALDLTGTKALATTGAELRYSKDQFEEGTIANFTDRADVLNYKFEPWSLKSRFVTPIHLAMDVERRFHPHDTSMGKALEFDAPEEIKDLGKVDRANRESPLKLAVPYVAHSVVRLENVEVVGSSLKNCKVSSPWIDYEFRFSQKPVQIVREMTIKSYSIPREGVRSADFGKFQEELRECGRSKYLIFKLRGRH